VRVARRALRLLARPPHLAVVRAGKNAIRDCRVALVFALECVPRGRRLQRGERWVGDAAGSETPRRLPSLKRSLLSIIKRVPSSFGWCRTRWSCATLALELKARRKAKVSRETIRRWLHDVGYVWKRARHVARDDDVQRVEKLARIRATIEGLLPSEALFFHGRTRHSLVGKDRVRVDAQGNANGSHDAGNKSETLSGGWT